MKRCHPGGGRGPKIYIWIPAFAGMAALATTSYAQSDLSRGIAAFEARHWPEAMDIFLKALEEDPSNKEVHTYVALTSQEINNDHKSAIRNDRLQILEGALKQKEAHQEETSVLALAVEETAHAEKHAQEEKWRARCDEARLERQAGRLLSANDIILQVLMENSVFIEAQQELSELQSATRQVLDHGSNLSVLERYALEGFYAYGQADYAAALIPWNKARALLLQNYSGDEQARQLNVLHFSAYEQVAQAHEEDQKQLAELKALVDGGVSLYQQRHFAEALEELRNLAIRDPNYPQLGYYLVQAEAAAENERAKHFGEKKRKEIERLFRAGADALEKENLNVAKDCFERTLQLDPTHSQARSYLALVIDEIQKRHDPKAAQVHYETGLVAYASGKLEEAVRQWQIAVRMNPQHEKALNALSKVQKELALNREPPNEVIP